MIKKPHLRKYSEVRPTEADADEFEKVMAIYDDFRYCTDFLWGSLPCGYKYWCRTDEWQAHIGSLINDDTDDEDESGWVYAKDRWPTEEDGKCVLWMTDAWAQPCVAMVEEFSDYSTCEEDNLRWHRLPPDPPKKPRELPAKPIDVDALPLRVTTREGRHFSAIDKSGNGRDVMCVESYRTGHWLVVNSDGHFAESKEIHPNDIVHVGGWLSAAELEALKNGI